MSAPLRHKAYEIPSHAIAQHLRGLVTVRPICSVCGQLYTRVIEREMVPLLMEQGWGQCDVCYTASEAARDMEE